jgi:flagellin
MQINQNIAAFNAYRNLSTTQDRLGSSLEKLSSGFRINRAADDAAGLVNSENLRSQIGGLQVATRNAQDAISLVQTAEGAQTEVHSILQRMRDLASQSGNLGTNDDVALQANQQEIDELVAELDRIAGQTQFGTQTILDGTFADEVAPEVDISAAVTATQGVDASDDPVEAELSFDISALQEMSQADLNANDGEWLRISFDIDGAAATIDVDFELDDEGAAVFTDAAVQSAIENAIDGDASLDGSDFAVSVTDGVVSIATDGNEDDNVDIDSLAFGVYEDDNGLDDGSEVTDGALHDAVDAIGATMVQGHSETLETTGQVVIDTDALDLSGVEDDEVVFTLQLGEDQVEVSVEAADADDATALSEAISSALTDSGVEGWSVDVAGDNVTVAADEAGENAVEVTATDGASTTAAVFQVGANEGQTVEVAINAVSSEALNIDAIDVTTSAGVDEAIVAIDGAIGDVSANRAELGAFQNRMESTIRNVSVAVENLSAAESRIRDTDMAQEMVSFTRAQILSQAGTAMLAQANQVPQSVLSLLR